MSVRCDFTVEDAMFLLKRNWFMSDQDVYDLFWELPEEVYFHVFDRRDELPVTMQHLFPVPYPNLSKLKIHDITDKEWDDEMIRKEEQRIQAVRRFKKNYIAPPRPREDFDDTLDKLESQIGSKRIVLEDMIRLSRKVGNTEPMVRDTRQSLEKLENEFSRLKERASTLDKLWSEQKCVDAMLSNVGSLYAT
jgi:hypothetical protein